MLLTHIPFDLDLTLCCGQIFKWEKKDQWWCGIIEDKPIKIRQLNIKLEIKNINSKLVKSYFGLNDNLYDIKRKICRDKHIEKALNKFWGLRIIHQDPWECLISYICATYKSIPAIRKMLYKLSEKFGEKKILDDNIFFTFPKPEKLQSAKKSDLLNCGLGYRSKYVLATSKKIFNNESFFEDLKKLPYLEAKKNLIDLPGVGPKVADCVLLFSLGKKNSFPIDIWIKRVILHYYSNHFSKQFISKISNGRGLSNSDYDILNKFGRTYFGEYAGYAQEYLYHFERMIY